MAASICCWNMNQNPEAWAFLDSIKARTGASVFLLQEAKRPQAAPEGLVVFPAPDDIDAWRILPQRNYCSAIAAIRAEAEARPRTPIPMARAKADWGEFVASHPGQFAAVDVTLTVESVDMTVVSLYGIWDKMPDSGSLFADATLHRAISDLSVVFQERGADHIVVGGDLNVWHESDASGPVWRRRYDVVFDRMAAHGLELLGPFRADTDAVLEDCPCGHPDTCRHVNTYRYLRKATSKPYQNDYVFATRAMAGRLVRCYAVTDDDVWRYSDHLPVVAEFEF